MTCLMLLPQTPVLFMTSLLQIALAHNDSTRATFKQRFLTIRARYGVENPLPCVYRIHSISINRTPDPFLWTKHEQRDTDRGEAKKLERKILTHKRLKERRKKKKKKREKKERKKNPEKTPKNNNKTLFIRTKRNMRFFGIPLSSHKTTLKQQLTGEK